MSVGVMVDYKLRDLRASHTRWVGRGPGCSMKKKINIYSFQDSMLTEFVLVRL